MDEYLLAALYSQFGDLNGKYLQRVCVVCTGTVLIVTTAILWTGKYHNGAGIVTMGGKGYLRSDRTGGKNIGSELKDMRHTGKSEFQQNSAKIHKKKYPAITESKVHKYELQNSNHNTTQKYCKEQRHVVFVRIPKTGSSTVTHVMWRFGNRRGLRFLLPKPGYDGSQHRLAVNTFYLPRTGKFCDMMANHVVYNYESFSRYFPPDLVLISLLREPMNQLYSTIYYFKNLAKLIPGTNKVSTYLDNPLLFEKRKGRSFTHNSMMSYFGLEKRDFFKEEKIQKKIEELDEKFAVILILEQLDVSLVLLKRRLCWTTKDIIYSVKNKNAKKPVITIATEDYDRLKNWSRADYVLYNYFLNKLQQEIEKEGKDFNEEVAFFGEVQNRTAEFCRTFNSEQPLVIQASKFSPEFEVTSRDCQIMATGGLQMLKSMRSVHKTHDFCS